MSRSKQEILEDLRYFLTSVQYIETEVTGE